MTNQEILQSLAGDETAFGNALRSLGWFAYPPTLSEAPYKGTARAALNPRLRFCGNIEQGNVHVYRLLLPNAATWRDTVAVAESHLRAEPQFAIFFRSLPGAILIVVPADPDKARNKSHSITAACAYVCTENPSANDLQTIERLRHAPRDGFRRPLQEMANAERVTKKFYDEFDKKARTPFLANIQGIPDDKDRDWYASVMLNRIMFLFFLQEQGYMDNDLRYLPNRLANFRGNHPKNLFHRGFMLPLFHDALGSRTHADALKELTGDAPYLNGGIFAKHALEEKYGENIAIPDEAYDAVFRFFGDWNWCLDDRPMRTEREINPDVLGYIFEKYINRKQMGAYYTKEDITEYIGRNTIVPFLVERSLENYAFRVTDLSTGKPDPVKMRNLKSKMIGLLRERPDDYIFDAVKKGTNIPLPPEIEEGISDVSKRGPWNKPAPEEYALPTEWWREVVARRQRYEEIISSIAGKESFDINDFITLNLNIRQWLEDFLHVCDDEAYRAAFRETLTQCRILDPTCGSGAFLFAALNILLPLYDAVDPNADPYHTLKTIILHNLYGVDIMDEAVEICKLRLFLKLAAQKPPHPDAPNHGLEPLPDMDFNIRAGNTLVGYATLDQLEKGLSFDAAQGKLGFEDEALQRILGQAEKIRELYELFCEEQLKSDTEVEREVMSIRKATMRCELNALNEELDQLLAKQYGVQPGWKQAYAKWKESHRPFHWFTEFYGAMSRGGFDVIIGNPPYVEYGNVRGDYAIRGYETESCGNLYAYVMERCIDITCSYGRNGMIVQLPIVCTDRMQTLQDKYWDSSCHLWLSNFDDRPGRLFEGLEHIRASIVISTVSKKDPPIVVHSTCYNRWYTEKRDSLFNMINYNDITNFRMRGSFPKIGDCIAVILLKKMISFSALKKHLLKNSQSIIYFHNAPQYWIRAMNFTPYFWNERGGEQISTQVKSLSADKSHADIVVAVLNSSLFYWWFIILSDCRHLNMREIETFPIGLDEMSSENRETLKRLSTSLMIDLQAHAQRKDCTYKTTGRVIYDEFYPRYSKSIIDEIDRVLAKHYGFSEEELDFIINYDIKYRMGREE